MNRALWIVQGLLALLFLFGGGAKLSMPLDDLAAQSGLPGGLLLFISVAEVLGGLGLVLPGLLRLRPGLTPLAAAGLVLVTIGATVYQLAAGQVGNAIFAIVIGLLAAFVAYGRWRLAPLRESARRSALQPAA